MVLLLTVFNVGTKIIKRILVDLLSTVRKHIPPFLNCRQNNTLRTGMHGRGESSDEDFIQEYPFFKADRVALEYDGPAFDADIL